MFFCRDFWCRFPFILFVLVHGVSFLAAGASFSVVLLVLCQLNAAEERESKSWKPWHLTEFGGREFPVDLAYEGMLILSSVEGRPIHSINVRQIAAENYRCWSEKWFTMVHHSNRSLKEWVDGWQERWRETLEDPDGVSEDEAGWTQLWLCLLDLVGGFW